MRVLITGASGTLGSEWQSFLSRRPDCDLIVSSHEDLNLADYAKSASYITALHAEKPIDVIVNCAALVNTVGIETSLATRNSSFLANALIPKYLASICHGLGIKLVHYSTDYIFSEQSKPAIGGIYDEFPINGYGYHKLIGELFVQREMASSEYLIARVGWIYGCLTKRTFIHKFMKNVMAHVRAGRMEVGVVDDQVSTPTSVQYIVETTMALLGKNACGILSVCPSGSVSKLDYARRILSNLDTIVGLSDMRGVRLYGTSTDQEDIPYPLKSGLGLYTPVTGGKTWAEDLDEYMTLHRADYQEYAKELLTGGMGT